MIGSLTANSKRFLAQSHLPTSHLSGRGINLD
jgi:hypothetical protein